MKLVSNDMPKLESPFVRITNEKGEYIVTPEIAKGFEWVFEDDTVLAIEKLHGTNVSIIIENGVIASIWNRTARIPIFNKGKKFIVEAVLESFDRGYCELPDGQWFGEVIGPKVNGNNYSLTKHVWIPFRTFGVKHLKYKSWGKYPKDFNTISNWFKELMPLYALMQGDGKALLNDDGSLDRYDGFVEGIVFTHPDGRMAKLRRDMFDWYTGTRHKEVENDKA